MIGHMDFIGVHPIHWMGEDYPEGTTAISDGLGEDYPEGITAISDGLSETIPMES